MKPLSSSPSSYLTLSLASSLWLLLATGCVVPNALTPDKAYWQEKMARPGGTYVVTGTCYGGTTNPTLVFNATNLPSYISATVTNGDTQVARVTRFGGRAGS